MKLDYDFLKKMEISCTVFKEMLSFFQLKMIPIMTIS